VFGIKKDFAGQDCRQHEIGYATASIVNSTFGIKEKVAVHQNPSMDIKGY